MRINIFLLIVFLLASLLLPREAGAQDGDVVSPTPLPEAYYDASAVFETVKPGISVPDNSQEACRQMMLPLLQSPNAASTLEVSTASIDAVVSVWQSPLGIIDGCITPSMVPLAVLPCPNPVRTNLLKDDNGNGWSYELRCDNQIGQIPVFLGNVQTMPAGVSPGSAVAVLGIAGASYLAGQLADQLKKVEFYIRPQIGSRQEGELEFASEQEARDWVMAQGFIPGSQQDVDYVARMMQVDSDQVDGEMLSALHYYVDPRSISGDLLVYKSSAMGGSEPPVGLLAKVQYAVGDGSGQVTGVISFYFSTGRPSIPIGEAKPWLEMTWDEARDRFPLPPMDPGIPPLPDPNKHLDKVTGLVDPGRAQLRAAMHVTLYNWVQGFVARFKRPPWDWCGIRSDPAGGEPSCACVKYSAAYIDVLGKIYDGLMAIVNGNSTVIGVRRPPGPFEPLTESARPRQNGFSDPSLWTTLGTDEFNRCSPAQQEQLGLNFAS